MYVYTFCHVTFCPANTVEELSLRHPTLFLPNWATKQSQASCSTFRYCRMLTNWNKLAGTYIACASGLLLLAFPKVVEICTTRVVNSTLLRDKIHSTILSSSALSMGIFPMPGFCNCTEFSVVSRAAL